MADRTLGIIGLGTFGRAIAVTAVGAGTRVLAWTRSPRSRKRTRSKGDIELPQGVELVDEPVEVVEQARTVFFALPAYAMREVVDAVGDAARGDHYWLHASKGLAEDGGLMHEIMRGRTCVKQIAAVGGPIMASELVRRGAEGMVAASRYACVLKTASTLLFDNGRSFSRSNDVIGVEVAGALRNVISVAVGLASQHGEAIRSTLMARGLIETARLGTALGAAPATFVGMAGVGDLIARREASTSRNYRVGEQIAAGEEPEAVMAAFRRLPEGAITARAAATRAQALRLEMPLTQGVAAVLDGEVSVKEMIQGVLATDTGLGSGDSLV